MTRRMPPNPARRDAIRAMVLEGIKPRMAALATGVRAKAISARNAVPNARTREGVSR